ncbi:lipoprotein [Spiroplasma endosymbiont of Atherix ibis]|uniref:lipoprotein n=1 Tax=Spiroplasma endosymbiont of Atherix ibis TaxID=3066291 RepID=UPI0030CACBD2
MKKLLSIFATTSFVATASITVISCNSKDKIKDLTLASDKTNKMVVQDLLENAFLEDKTPISVDENNKLKNDYKDSLETSADPEKYPDYKISAFKGTFLEFKKESKLKDLFNETSKIFDNLTEESLITYAFSFSDKKGDTFGVLYLIKLDNSNLKWDENKSRPISGLVKATQQYKYKVNFLDDK